MKRPLAIDHVVFEMDHIHMEPHEVPKGIPGWSWFPPLSITVVISLLANNL